jgi:hypothetical protein
MDGDLHDLPDDPAALKAMISDIRRSNSSLEAEVAALKAASADAQARIERLQLLLKTIQRATYGRSSEKLDDSQYAFAFEEVQTGLAAVEQGSRRCAHRRASLAGGVPCRPISNGSKRSSSRKSRSARAAPAPG